jgi:hypothetical protein
MTLNRHNSNSPPYSVFQLAAMMDTNTVTMISQLGLMDDMIPLFMALSQDIQRIEYASLSRLSFWVPTRSWDYRARYVNMLPKLLHFGYMEKAME